MPVYPFGSKSPVFARAIRVLLLALTAGAVCVGNAFAQSDEAKTGAAPVVDAPTDETRDWWTSGRYRLTPSDVMEVTFPYVPEFNQTVAVQPDGYITLRPIGEVRVEGRTLPELQTMLIEQYASVLREPAIAIVLREFEKPYFIAAGEVKSPGKFELRGRTTVTQALALAGGLNAAAKSSQVIVFRRYVNDLLEVKQLNVERMMSRRDVSEDLVLRPGDTVYVPKSMLLQIAPYILKASLSFYLNPFNY
jgi:protein involved in polysaccharide export with SLBB domain